MPVSTNVAFAMLLRQARLKQNMTQKNLAKQLGLKNVYSYQRLENPKTANPALKTIAKIKKALPDLKIESILS